MSRLAALPVLLVLAALGPGDLGAQEDDEYRFPDVPFVVTPMGVVEAMLEVVEPTPSDTLYDLGSGDGRIPIMAAAQYGAHGVGVELQDTLVRISRRNARRAGVADRVRFVQGDLFEADVRPATIVSLYLFQHLNLRLRPKLLRELRPGARVVSHHFDMGEWEPDSTVAIPGHMDNVYFWVVPANVAGTWRLQVDGDEVVTLEIDQRFQELRPGVVRERAAGTAPGGRPSPPTVTDARVRGDSVFLVLRVPEGEEDGRTRLRLRGVAAGDRIEGATQDGRQWAAARISGGGESLEEWSGASPPRRREQEVHGPGGTRPSALDGAAGPSS